MNKWQVNHCDLEETKKVALDKFIELCNKPEKWRNTVATYHDFSLGGFSVGSFTCLSFGTYVTLNGVNIFYFDQPLSFHYGTDGYPRYEKDRNEYDSHPVVIAAKKIYAYRKQLDEQEKCKALLEGLKDYPRVILDTDPDFPTDLREKMNRPWWKFWV